MNDQLINSAQDPCYDEQYERWVLKILGLTAACLGVIACLAGVLFYFIFFYEDWIETPTLVLGVAGVEEIADRKNEWLKYKIHYESSYSEGDKQANFIVRVDAENPIGPAPILSDPAPIHGDFKIIFENGQEIRRPSGSFGIIIHVDPETIGLNEDVFLKGNVKFKIAYLTNK